MPECDTDRRELPHDANAIAIVVVDVSTISTVTNDLRNMVYPSHCALAANISWMDKTALVGHHDSEDRRYLWYQ